MFILVYCFCWCCNILKGYVAFIFNQLDLHTCRECGQPLLESYEPPANEPWTTDICGCAEDHSRDACSQRLFLSFSITLLIHLYFDYIFLKALPLNSREALQLAWRNGADHWKNGLQLLKPNTNSHLAKFPQQGDTLLSTSPRTCT